MRQRVVKMNHTFPTQKQWSDEKVLCSTMTGLFPTPCRYEAGGAEIFELIEIREQLLTLMAREIIESGKQTGFWSINCFQIDFGG